MRSTISYLWTYVFIIILYSNIDQKIEANVLRGVPEDMFGVNMTLLNNNIYDAVDIMNEINESNEIDLQEYIRNLFLLIWRLPIVDISAMHRYESYNDKLISGGPKVNKSDCGNKLRYLVNKMKSYQLNGSLVESSTDYRLFNLLDSFGRPSSSFLHGDILWLGEYDQCLSAKYQYQSPQNTKLSHFRYCLAHLRWPHWKHFKAFKEWTYSSVKSAICIPDSCDSINAETDENKELIKQLMGVNFGSAFSNFAIGDIYCLPDKESPLTSWTSETPATLCVVFLLIWFSMIALATVKDLFGYKSSFVKRFSLLKNTEKLFYVGTRHTNVDAKDKQDSTASIRLVKVNRKTEVLLDDKVDPSSNTNQDISNESDSSVNNGNVNLNYLHCMKAILLFLVMKTHFFLFMISTTRIYDWSISFDYFDLYHMSFAGMAVNVFFTISGTLVAFMLFEKFPPYEKIQSKSSPPISMKVDNRKPVTQSNSESFVEKKADLKNVSRSHPLLSPGLWFVFCVNRYLRLMPLWATMTLIVKYLAKYTGQGPVWDYGTSAGTNSHLCREESLLYLFLALVNVKPVNQNCIASSWYIAIDLQCAIIVTPIVIIAYLKAPRAMFLVSMILPFVQFFHYLLSDTYIPDEIKNMTRYGAKSIASFAVFSHELQPLYYYTPARAIYYIEGLLTGYMLHIYKSNGKSTKSSTLANNSESAQANIAFINDCMRIIRSPIVSNWFVLATSLLIAFSSVWFTKYLPERYLSFTSDIALVHVLMAVTMFMYSFIVPILLLQLSTGSLGNSKALTQFFNWTGWLPFSRMSLSILLVDPTVIILYNLRMKRTIPLDLDMHVTIMLAQSVIIYLISFLVHVTLEAPMKSFLTAVQMKLMRIIAPNLK